MFTRSQFQDFKHWAKHSGRRALSALGLALLTGCASIDCSLDSVVVWTLSFYDSATEEPLKLPCILNVEAMGGVTLYNRAQNVSSIELPMSNANPTDTLLLSWIEVGTVETEEGPVQVATRVETDVLFIDHTNHPHFDAIDCPGAIFHNITDLRHDASYRKEGGPMQIDSIRIIRPTVDYNDVENIRIYLSPATDTDAQ